MGLTTFSQLVFKFPAHRKKVSQFLLGHVSRFETAKGQRRHQLLPETRPLIEGWLQRLHETQDGRYLFLSRNLFKKDPKAFFTPIELLVKKFPDPFEFPADHF
jgi:hypothetical protein